MPMAKRGRWLGRALTVLAASASALPALAEEAASPGVLTFILENDIFAGFDEQYTNGAFLRYSPSPGALPQWALFAREQMSGFVHADTWRVTYGLGQAMFAPNDITLRDPPLDDRPYAGYLFGTVALSADTGTRLDTVALDLGVVGPPSLAEQAQKLVHNFIGDDPKGWDTQLPTEVAFRVVYEQSHKIGAALGPEFWGLEVDAIPQATVALGTVDTSLSGALTLRAGRSLDMDYGPPRVRRSLAGFAAVDKQAPEGWYVFVSAEGRLVGRNLFLDGATFRDSRSVDSETFVPELAAGAALRLRGAMLTYSHVFRAPEFETRNGWTQFGSLSLQIPF